MLVLSKVRLPFETDDSVQALALSNRIKHRLPARPLMHQNPCCSSSRTLKFQQVMKFFILSCLTILAALAPVANGAKELTEYDRDVVEKFATKLMGPYALLDHEDDYLGEREEVFLDGRDLADDDISWMKKTPVPDEFSDKTKCLDGSPFYIYVRPASNPENRNKVAMYLMVSGELWDDK